MAARGNFIGSIEFVARYGSNVKLRYDNVDFIAQIECPQLLLDETDSAARTGCQPQ